MGCGSCSEVATSRGLQKERAADSKALGHHLDGIAAGEAVSVDTLVALCEVPEVRKVLARIRGASMDATSTAHLLMHRYDADGTGVLYESELAEMKEELTNLAKAPFFVFLNEKYVGPSDTVNGIVVLDTDKPVKASSITARLICTAQAKFCKPETVASGDTTKTVQVEKQAWQPLVMMELPLYSTSDGTLPAGLHRWPFSFTLPAHAPDSFAVEGSGYCPQGNGEASPGSLRVATAVRAFAHSPGTAGRTALEARLHVTGPQSAHYTANNVQLPPQLLTSGSGEDMATPPCCWVRPCNGASKRPVIMYEASISLPQSQQVVVPQLGGPALTLRKGDKLQAAVTVRQVGGSKVLTSWSSQLAVSCHLNLIAQGLTWAGYADVAETKQEGESLEAGEVKHELQLTYDPAVARRLRAVGLSCALGSCVPKVQVSVLAESPIACESQFMKLRQSCPVVDVPAFTFHLGAGKGGGAGGKEEEEEKAGGGGTGKEVAAISASAGGSGPDSEWWQLDSTASSAFVTAAYPAEQRSYEMFTYRAPAQTSVQSATTGM